MGNGESEGKDLIPQSSLEDDDLISIADVAEKRVEAVKKIISMALKVTSEKDWLDQNGKPYLQGEGAEAVANLFGVSWTFIEKPYKVQEENGHYRYECVLQVKFKQRVAEVMGVRSTKDPFFTTRYQYNPTTKEKDKIDLIPSDVDSGDVMKSCITNAIGNGVTRILGIRNATWDMLKEAGLKIDKIQKLTYKEGEAKTQPQREEIRSMLLALNSGNADKAQKQLREITLYKGKSKNNVNELTDAQVPVIYSKVKKLWEDAGKPATKSTEPPKEESDEKKLTLTEQQVHDFNIAIRDAQTLDDLLKVMVEVEKAGIKGEGYTHLLVERDKRATALKGSLV